MISLALQIIVCFGFFVQAGGEPVGKVQKTDPTAGSKKVIAQDPSIQAIDNAFKFYWQKQSAHMKVRRDIYNNISEKKISAFGTLVFSKGKIRLDIDEPTKSTLVFEKDFIWYAEAPTELFPKWRISKVSREKAERAQALFKLLFGQVGVIDQLDLMAHKSRDGFESHIFKPKKQSDFPGVVKLAIVMSQDQKQVRLVRLWDDLDNETTFEFTDVDYDKKIAKNFFDYKPPKNSEIQEF